MPDENDTPWPPSRPPRTASNASQVSVASVRVYRRSVPSTKFDAGTSGVFRGAPGTRSGRPPTMAQVSGFIGLAAIVQLGGSERGAGLARALGALLAPPAPPPRSDRFPACSEADPRLLTAPPRAA